MSPAKTIVPAKFRKAVSLAHECAATPVDEQHSHWNIQAEVHYMEEDCRTVFEETLSHINGGRPDPNVWDQVIRQEKVAQSVRIAPRLALRMARRQEASK